MVHTRRLVTGLRVDRSLWPATGLPAYRGAAGCLPVLVHRNASMPAAGPDIRRSGAMEMGMEMGMGSSDAKLIQYLESHQQGKTYLFATERASTAAPVILATGKAVMAFGGFLGSDPALTVGEMARMAAAGQGSLLPHQPPDAHAGADRLVDCPALPPCLRSRMAIRPEPLRAGWGWPGDLRIHRWIGGLLGSLR